MLCTEDINVAEHNLAYGPNKNTQNSSPFFFLYPLFESQRRICSMDAIDGGVPP